MEWIIVGLMLNLIATILLFFGSRESPWGIRALKGKSELEETVGKKTKWATRTGFFFLFVGFLFQLIGVISH